MNKQKLTKRLDGYQNVMTGLGVSGYDRNMDNRLYADYIGQNEATLLFNYDDIAGKIAKTIPYDAVREGVEWQVTDDTEAEAAKDIFTAVDDEYQRLDAWGNMFWTASLARAYGGAVLFVSVDDGMELDEPLNLNRVKKINNLVPIDRWDINISSADIDGDITSPRYGLPVYYRFQNQTVGAQGGAEHLGQRLIHHSRVIVFRGERCPMRTYVANGYFDNSIYCNMLQAIKNYSSSHDMVANISNVIGLGVYNIEGLAAAVESDADELVIKRIQNINRLKSTLRAIVLDEGDKFEFIDAKVAGLDTLVDIGKQRLVAASNYPHTRLLGESPGASLGEAGRSQLTDYYDVVAAWQKVNLSKPIRRLNEIINAQTDFKTKLPEAFSFKFNPLYQEDQATIIENKLKQAQADNIYMAAGVVDAEEIAKSRFGGSEYSFDTHIDDEIREDEPDINEFIPVAEPSE